jgi:hypothetical protein
VNLEVDGLQDVRAFLFDNGGLMLDVVLTYGDAI